METPKNTLGDPESQDIKKMAAEVLEDFKSQIGGKMFTVTNFAQDSDLKPSILLTVLNDKSHPGRAMWDSQVSNFLFVRKPGDEHTGTMKFVHILNSSEADTVISGIMAQRNIPKEKWEKVRVETKNLGK